MIGFPAPGCSAFCLALLLLALPSGLQAQAPGSPLKGEDLFFQVIDRLQAGDLEAAAQALAPVRDKPAAPLPALSLLAELEARLGTTPILAPSLPPDAGPHDTGPPDGDEELSTRLLRAEGGILTRHPDRALAALAPFLSAEPASAPLRVRRAAGRAYLLAGRLDAAVTWLRFALDEDPPQGAGVPSAGHRAHPATALALARALYQQGEADEALAVLAPHVRELTNGPPTAGDSSPRVRLDLLLEHGRISVASGRAPEALPALRRAVALAPDSAQAWQALGQALLLSGEPEKGREALARFSELQARTVPPPIDVAALLPPGSGTPAEAPEGDPAGTRAEVTRRGAEIVERSLARARAGDREGALAELEREIDAAPELLEPRFLLVSLLLALERPDEAWAAAGEAVAAFPEEPEALYHRGIVALVRRDLAAAEADLRATLLRAPRHTLAMNNLAVVLLQQGRTAEGREWLERVLAIDPDDALAQQNLARLDASP